MVRAHVDTNAIPVLIADLRRFESESWSALQVLAAEQSRVVKTIDEAIRSRQSEANRCLDVLRSCDPDHIEAARRALAAAEERLAAARRALSIVTRSAARFDVARSRWNWAVSSISGEAIPMLVRTGQDLEVYFGTTVGASIGATSEASASPVAGPVPASLAVPDGFPAGFALVPLGQVDDSDSGVTGPESFGKGYSVDDLAWAHAAFERVILPHLAAGGTFDGLRDRDQREGRVGVRSFADTYSGFLGGDAIHLERHGDRFTVNNGYHRIWVARQLGLDHIPARVVGL